MPCSGEEVGAADPLRRVAVSAEIFRVARRGGRVARYHHDLFGSGSDDVSEGLLRAALARRVNDDDVGSTALFAELTEDLARVAAVELRVGDAVALGVSASILDRLGDYLHADDTSRAPSHRQPYRTRAAVEVGDGLAACRSGIFERLRVEALRLHGVDLIEGKRRDLDLIAAHLIGNGVASPERETALAENDVRARGIDIEHDTFDVGEALGQLLAERHKLP